LAWLSWLLGSLQLASLLASWLESLLRVLPIGCWLLGLPGCWLLVARLLACCWLRAGLLLLLLLLLLLQLCLH
jgi:hypothetical protein